MGAFGVLQDLLHDWNFLCLNEDSEDAQIPMISTGDDKHLELPTF